MSKILIINGPNLNLLGEREQSQYGKEDYKFLIDICKKRSEELKIELEIKQSNLEGEIVDLIQWQPFQLVILTYQLDFLLKILIL